jgi:cobalt/nickel transport system permease protein
MNLQLLDSYSRLDSPIRRLPSGLKLILAVGGVIMTVLLPLRFWEFHAAWSLLLIAVVLASRIPAGFLIKRLLILEPLVIGVAMLAWFQPNGGRVFFGLVVKSSLCLFTMVLLSNTTPFADLVSILRRLPTPPLLVTTLALMYRYLFVLVDEAERMKRARASRTFRPGHRRTWKDLGSLVAQLFIRSSERAERIYAAMCARGWK